MIINATSYVYKKRVNAAIQMTIHALHECGWHKNTMQKEQLERLLTSHQEDSLNTIALSSTLYYTQ
jgi:hypothetical protein